eukprot:TRINITY_DN7082_c0_g1_i1.p1 TRINITY_DN7082_c0_g1~~TRINITY_DN7082_c0_g1_i1.p1  ORF type:complete len:362 (-),score=47.10 TRINITY_DN7082_c0_g1_i1:158-1243(-)
MDDSLIVNSAVDLLRNYSSSTNGKLSVTQILDDFRIRLMINSYITNVLLRSGKFESPDGLQFSLKAEGTENAAISASSSSSAPNSAFLSSRPTKKSKIDLTERPDGALTAEEFRHKGFYLLKSSTNDALACRCWAPEETLRNVFPLHPLEGGREDFQYRLPEFEWHPLSGSRDPTPLLFVKISPFGSYLLAAIVGGLGMVPCAPGSDLLFVGDDSPNSLYTLFVLSNVQGPEGKVFTPFQTFSKHRDAFDRIIGACKNIVDFVASNQSGEPFLDALFVESAESTDPVGNQVKQYCPYLKIEALVGALMNSDVIATANAPPSPEAKYAGQVALMRQLPMKPCEQITLEPFFQKAAVLIGKKL